MHNNPVLFCNKVPELELLVLLIGEEGFEKVKVCALVDVLPLLFDPKLYRFTMEIWSYGAFGAYKF